MNDNGHTNGHDNIRKLLDEGVVLKAARIGAERARRIHKALGNPIVTNVGGKVVVTPPEEIHVESVPLLFTPRESRELGA